jgi:DNA modification methylase
MMHLEPGDCRYILTEYAATGEQFDSVVTDPPYHLTSVVKRFGGSAAKPPTLGVYGRSSSGFMGKNWDGGDIAFQPETWRAVYDVMKPGAYLLAFGGTRTWHRMAVAIEDAGFDIRDCVLWLYGTGFPKSHDTSKAIDQHLGAERPIIGTRAGLSTKQTRSAGTAVYGDYAGSLGVVTGPATPEAAAWQGWGTALKPAWEPIIMARKPIPGTIAANVLAHGVGAINIDASRVPYTGDSGSWGAGRSEGSCWAPGSTGRASAPEGRRDAAGRWPANVIHDGSAEVLDSFPAGESRFFYSAKATAADRAGSKHPTVKPLSLLRYLCRMITPPGGRVLDPFAGSGTTLQAAAEAGFRSVGIEREAEYQEDIRRRIASVEQTFAELVS